MLRDSRVWFDRVRPGLLLYGIVPPPLARRLRCAGHDARQQGRRGEGTAARRDHRLRRPIHARTADHDRHRPRRYADGLDLRLAGRGFVLIRGRRAPIVGSVCMDMLMADVTGIEVSPGDEVVIIGSQGERPSTCARWPPRSARFRGKSSVVWDRASNGCTPSAAARLFERRRIASHDITTSPNYHKLRVVFGPSCASCFRDTQR
jgi:hypothetical protein